MGDMGEMFKIWNETKKQQKQERYNKNMLIIQQCEFKYQVNQNRTILFKTQNGTVCFYPSTNTFTLKSKVYYGDAKSVLGFIRNMR